MKFREGDKVEFIWLGKLIQGVVTEIEETKNAISYQIKYSGAMGMTWLDEKELIAPTPVLKVPQFADDWINHCEQREYDLACLLDYEDSDMSAEMYEWLISSADNQELLARAWLDGYEVEKEPVWVVENENGYRLRSITMNPGNSLNWSFDSKNKNYIEFEEFETAKKAAYLVTGNVTEI
ncbi:DUF1642 domain-containing protein [Listeria monocytogenes]|uniref:DUF1642 domain-containing protein n=2 Tax=root TaxID=1 RepID=A0A0B5D0I5_9CAUD|nr:DUF1642 domain-containing protein [Listeria monocytogenes]YP_009210501.1 DUF1642 domain-containing protein [Listeria phage vB_LmoS_293]EHC6154057.1 DUF1642 domain-containing protein [Listeria monocytogenes serotype 4b]HAA0104292.1 DUF1642 domain-containing protein [Listeria monocytogenes CC70B]AJE28118.1 hypothetical protein SE25_053 [Listeria phage vB_LmoS_293]ASH65788.1 conserved hypothetical phage protein [Listeria monocytogenes serotype 4b str. 02-1103]ASH68706.1 conserved hypothetical